MLVLLFIICLSQTVDIFTPLLRNIPIYEDIKEAEMQGRYPILNLLENQWKRIHPFFRSINRVLHKMTSSREEQKLINDYMEAYTPVSEEPSFPLHTANAQTCSGKKFGSSCQYDCVHGNVVDSSYCMCNTGFKDPFCNTSCLNGYYDTSVSSHCRCYNGYVASDCSVLCVHGRYDSSTGSCVCNNGY